MSDYRKYGTSRANDIVIEDPHKCFVCGGPVGDDVVECPKCGFPQHGDEASQRWFLGQLRHEKIEENYAAFRVGHTFDLLLGVPVILVFVAAGFWQAEDVLLAEVSGLFCLAFLSTWVFGRKSPYRAFAVSLVLYEVMTVPLFIKQPSIIINTRFILLTPYLYLAIGMRSFRDWQAWDKDLEGKNTG
jgi:hypothetical protein